MSRVQCHASNVKSFRFSAILYSGRQFTQASPPEREAKPATLLLPGTYPVPGQKRRPLTVRMDRRINEDKQMTRPVFPFHATDISQLARSLQKQMTDCGHLPGHLELLNMLARAT